MYISHANIWTISRLEQFTDSAYTYVIAVAFWFDVRARVRPDFACTQSVTWFEPGQT